MTALATPPAPPQDLDAERSVLSAMMLGPEAIAAAARMLRPSSFYRAAHAKVFEAIRSIHMRGEPVDLITLADELERGDHLKHVGGHEFLAELLEYAGTSANLEAHAELVLKAERQRELIAHARALAEAARDSDDPAGTASEFASRLRDASASGASRRGLVSAFGASLTLTADDLNEPVSLLGDGLICGGDLAIFAGQPGLGKSRLALEMSVAMTKGEPWMGLPTAGVPVRVGYLALEFDNYRWIQRCVQVFGDGRVPKGKAELLEAFRGLELGRPGCSLHWATRQQMDGGVNLTSHRGATALLHAIEALSLNMVVVDALSRSMGGREEKNEVISEMTVHLDDVRYATNCAILLIHHEKKVDDRSKADRLSLVRGGTRFTTDVNTIITVTRTPSRMRVINFDKANYAREPEPIHYEIPEEGGPTLLVRAPDTVADKNLETLWAHVQANPMGVTGEEAAAATGLSKRTVYRLLGKLEERGLERVKAGSHGGGQRWMWRMGDSAE